MTNNNELNEKELANVSGGRGDNYEDGYEEYTYEMLASVTIGKIVTVFESCNLEDGAIEKARFAGKKTDANGEYYAAIGQRSGIEYKRRKNNNDYIFAVREIL